MSIDTSKFRLVKVENKEEWPHYDYLEYPNEHKNGPPIFGGIPLVKLLCEHPIWVVHPEYKDGKITSFEIPDTTLSICFDALEKDRE